MNMKCVLLALTFVCLGIVGCGAPDDADVEGSQAQDELTSTTNTCSTLPHCTSGTRSFVLYTQDVLAVCNTHHDCSSGSAGCFSGSQGLIGLCTFNSPASYCPTARNYGGVTAYTNCH
jgi:hypothetical protein